MTTAPAADPAAARNHVLHCRQYMGNALKALQGNEPGKAGELIWGSVSQAVHAVDAWRGPEIESHRGLVNFAYRLGREIGDPTFTYIFRSARSLHHNFYVPVDNIEEVENLLPGIQTVVNKILALLPDEGRNGTTQEQTDSIPC